MKTTKDTKHTHSAAGETAEARKTQRRIAQPMGESRKKAEGELKIKS
jgi:hypothetical protein